MKKNLIIFFLFFVSLSCSNQIKKVDYTNIPEDTDWSAISRNSMIINGEFVEKNPVPVITVYYSISPSFAEDFRRKGYWHLITDQGGRASVELSEKMAHIKMQNSGIVWYSIQFCYLPLSLEKGKKYVALFSVRSEINRDMIFEICQVGSWISHCKRTTLHLTADWKTFSIPFTMNQDSNPYARFEFNVGGGKTTDIYFKDVYLSELKL